MNKFVSTLANVVRYIKCRIEDSKLLLSILILLFILTNLFHLVKIVGVSMEPTLHDSDRCIISVNKWIKYKPNRGDIVIFKKKSYGNKYLIKRVIGVPGDLVEIKDNEVYVNGELLNEPYIAESMRTVNLTYDVGDGQIFVLGDNRNNSSDSRLPSIGLIYYEREVLGKLLFNISEGLNIISEYF